MQPAHPRRRLLAAAILLGPAALGAGGASTPVEDQVEIVHVDRRLIGTSDGGTAILPLAADERVVEVRNRGLLGVAATTRRLIGLRAGDGHFAELPLRVAERADDSTQIHVGPRVALVAFPARLAAFAPAAPRWFELMLTPGERAAQPFVDANLAGALTPRRAIAFAAQSGFVDVALSPAERVEERTTSENSVTLVTSRRVLIFRAGARRWTEVPRELTTR